VTAISPQGNGAAETTLNGKRQLVAGYSATPGATQTFSVVLEPATPDLGDIYSQLVKWQGEKL